MASVTVYSATKILELLAQTVVNATKTVRGIVELATTEEVLAGLDDERAVTPLGVQTAIASTDLASMSSGTALDGYVPAADGAGGVIWEEATGGGPLGEALDAEVAALDANPNSAFRQQQDARHLSTFGPGFAVNLVAASGATETLPATHPAHNVTMDQNCTFTFPTVTGGFSFMLRLAGAYTPTFPASVKWSSGAAPAYTTPAVYTFTTFDGGTSWLGVQAGRAFA